MPRRKAFVCGFRKKQKNSWRSRALVVKKTSMIISDNMKLEEFCAPLHKADFITVDTEFLREKTYYPKLCLIQISGPDGMAAAIDPLAQDIALDPVFDLLFDESLLKVFHSARQDLEIFYNLTGKIVRPVFDTQIAAMVCGYGDQVGYEALIRNIIGAQIDKSSQFTNWSNRPLSEKQLDYALADVTHLCGAYRHLREKLAENGRTEWVFEEEEILSDPATYANPPERAWERIKVKSPKPRTLAVLKELAAWREEEAQKRDIPKGWILRDDTLADMAAQAPKDVSALKKIRGISADMAAGSRGKRLLELIGKALQSPPGSWPVPKKKKPLPPDSTACLDALKMLLKINAGQNGVAPRLLASQKDLEDLVQKEKTLDSPLLKGWRYEIFGRDALALQNGDLAIGIKHGKIVKFCINEDAKLHE